MSLVLTSLLTVGAYAHVLTISNRSGDSIKEAYISRSESGIWGTDRLGSNVMRNGSDWSMNLSTGYYDFKSLENDEDKCELFRIPLDRDLTIWIGRTSCFVRETENFDGE